MKSAIAFICLSLLASPYGFSQTVIKVNAKYVAIDPVENLDDLWGEKVTIQRWENTKLLDVGVVEFVREVKGKIFAKITDDNGPNRIKVGDFIKGYGPQSDDQVYQQSSSRINFHHNNSMIWLFFFFWCHNHN